MVNIMCRSSIHSELATSRLSTAFGERDDTCEQVMEAEQPSAASRGGQQRRQTLGPASEMGPRVAGLLFYDTDLA